jgi:hydrogenase assembly chaperone HypC/HupF
MCLVLPARVISVPGETAEVELHDGQRVVASTELTPSIEEGQSVLVDRGLVLRVIGAEEAEAIMEIYAEMEQLLESEPAPA